MNADAKPHATRQRDLSKLDVLALDHASQRLVEMARSTASGSAPWRARKLAEARELIALAQESGRYRIEWLDLAEDLRVLLTMRASVPCLPDPAGPLRFAPLAQIGLVYSEQALRWPTPGTSFTQIVAPRKVWLPNVSTESQVLCLGISMPAGIRATEIIHTVFGALTLRLIETDLLAAAGVLNPEAALWWQHNLDKLPTAHEPFACATETTQ